MFSIVAMGELLIDFTPVSQNGRVYYEQNPGGGPPNLLAAASRLGADTAFLGKVGQDSFGSFLAQTLESYGIDVEGLVRAPQPTTLAFVHLAENGERSFSFYRTQTADVTIQPEDICYDVLDQGRVLHYSSLTMTHSPSRETTFALLEHAKEKGIFCSFDPNLRPLLWDTREDAKTQILRGCAYADLLKVSEEELLFLTGESDLERGSQQLIDAYPISLILVTLGAKGCFYRMGACCGRVSGYPVDVVDTTGAGDGFLGGFLYGITRSQTPFFSWTEEELREMLRFANAVGALATTGRGGMPAMPTRVQMEEFLGL